MPRIGFVGTENSHTDHFIRFLNREGRHPGFRATALAGGHNERNLALAESGEIELIVDAPGELIGRVDAVIVSTRDGALHRAQAEPLLAAGMPVLVDKPLATTPADADAILQAAQATDTLVYSASALRFVPEIDDLKRSAGDLRHLHIVGPGDPDSPYSGLFFYGIHHVEAALELLDNPNVNDGEIDVTATREGDTTVAMLRLGGTALTLTFVAPDGAEQIRFHATGVHAGGVSTSELTVGPDYNAPALAKFVRALETGVAPVAAERMRAPIVVMRAIVDALNAHDDTTEDSDDR